MYFYIFSVSSFIKLSKGFFGNNWERECEFRGGSYGGLVMRICFYLLQFFSWCLFHIQASGLVVAVDDDGCFIEKISEFSGRYVKEADRDIINSVKVSCCFSIPWTIYCM